MQTKYNKYKKDIFSLIHGGSFKGTNLNSKDMKQAIKF